MKRFLTFLLLAVTLVCNAQNRIIGGSNATIQERPFQAAVFMNGQFNGGGVIINEHWILTAAHVVRNYVSQPSRYTVKYGSTYLDQCNTANVNEIILHPGFQILPNGSSVNDIALVRVVQPILTSLTSSVIPISTCTSFQNGQIATVSGWGCTSTNKDRTNILKKGNVTINSCSNGTIECSPSTTMIYYGDSGGPLTIDGNLIGIAREVYTILPTNHHSKYTNVGYYYNWIYEKMLSWTHFSAPSFLLAGNIATITCYTDFPIDSFSVSPNLTIISSTSNTVTVRATSSGYSYVYASILGRTFSTAFNVGLPVISDVYYNNGYLFVNMYGGATTNHTEWIIGGNEFSAYDSFIWCPDHYGVINIKVRAEVGGSWSNWYETQIDLNNNGLNYSFSISGNTINIQPNEDINFLSLRQNENELLSYNIINTVNQERVLMGQIDIVGGSIDISRLNRGNYVFVLSNKKEEKTFKFIR